MKFWGGLVFCLSGLCFGNITAQEIKEEQKIYIHPEQVRIAQDGIFVDFSGQSISVRAVHCDAAGTYVVTSEYRLSRCPRGHYSPDGDGLCDYPGCPYNR